MKLLVVWAVAIGAVIGSAAISVHAQGTERRHLQEPMLIQGVPCAKGFAWFYSDGKLERCFVSDETEFGEIRVPGGSEVVLLADGRPSYAMLSQDVPIGDLMCSGGGPLGPAEGAMTGLYPDGKLRYCFLMKDQAVQGVPCAAGGFWRAAGGHDAPVELYESGKLKSCLLATDFGGQRRWDRFKQAP